MAFRSDRQRSDACRVLLNTDSLHHYWFGENDVRVGPTAEGASQLRRIYEGTCSLSHSEKIMLRAAFDIWNGAGNVSMWEMMTYLDPSDVLAIGTLLMSAGSEDPQAVDDWIAQWSGDAQP